MAHPTEQPTVQASRRQEPSPAPHQKGEGGGTLPSAVGLAVDVRSPIPPYEQIRAQIAEHITAGRLRHGERLPSLRALAADLGVAAGTTARAYRELEAGGLVTSRRRTGTVVNAPATITAPKADSGNTADRAAHGVLEAAGELVRRAREAGWGEAHLIAAVRQALHASGQTREATTTHDLASTETSPQVLPTH